MSAHRYWRLFISRNQNSPYTSLSTLEFRGQIGGPSLCVGGVALANSFFPGTQPSYAPSNAFDNDTTTAWMSKDPSVFPVWIGYQFPSAVDIVEVAVTARVSTPSLVTTDQALKEFTVQWSDDGVAWQFAYSFASPPAWKSIETRVFTFGALRPSALQIAIRNAPAALSGSPRPKIRYNQGFAATDRLPRLRGALATSRRDSFFGRGSIAGTLTVEGKAAARYVRLLDSASGLVIDSVWSDAAGRYRFDLLDTRRQYLVIAVDYNRAFSPVAIDGVVPEPETYD